MRSWLEQTGAIKHIYWKMVKWKLAGMCIILSCKIVDSDWLIDRHLIKFNITRWIMKAFECTENKIVSILCCQYLCRYNITMNLIKTKKKIIKLTYSWKSLPWRLFIDAKKLLANDKFVKEDRCVWRLSLLSSWREPTMCFTKCFVRPSGIRCKNPTGISLN